jgi:ABC-2 type transport system ATP-binding protein
MPHSTIAIEAIGLKKIYQSSKSAAVDNLDLKVSLGETVAFLGPNGAGKSTTIKMLCGILKPDAGQALILGEPSGSRRANLSLGLVFGARSQLYFHMTVHQCLMLQAETYYVEAREQPRRIGNLAENFGATHLLGKRVRELSLGERMRCEIVASLIHQPKVILLDEPTIGLDIAAKLQLRQNLKEWQQKENVTILLTSHDLSDVEALCDRCVLINKGKKAYDGKLNQVMGDLAGIRRIKLSLGEPSASAVSTLPSLRELFSDNALEKSYEFRLEQIPLAQVMEYLSGKYGAVLRDIQITGVRLEEVIQKRYA